MRKNNFGFLIVWGLLFLGGIEGAIKESDVVKDYGGGDFGALNHKKRAEQDFKETLDFANQKGILKSFTHLDDFAQTREFMISYRAKLEGEQIVGEEYRISKVIGARGSRGVIDGSFRVMKKCTLIPQEMIDLEGVERFLKQNIDGVLACLHTKGVQIYDEVIVKNQQARSKTILKLPPTRVLALLKDGVVELSVLEKR